MAAPARTSGSSLEHRALGTFTQRMRARVGASIAMALMLGILLFMVPAAFREGRWLAMSIELCAVLVFGGLVHLFRRDRSPTLPATIFLCFFFVLFVITGAVEDGLYVSASSWAGLLALLSLYLLGSRYGSIFAILAVLQIGLSYALHRSGMSLLEGYISPPDSWMAVSGSAVSVMLIAALGYLYEGAQKRALGELEGALVTSEQNELQLHSLFESTSAAICALDRDLRLVTCNRAFARMASRTGVPPQRGESLERLLPREQYTGWRLHIDRLLGAGDTPGERARGLAEAAPITFEEPPPAGQEGPYRETTMHAMPGSDGVAGVTVFSRDITARKRADAEMQRLQQDLVRVSREAGMAVVASEVLHNAGNVLNSTGVSVAMLERHVKNLRIDHLARAVAMLEEHAGDLDAFVRDDPRGKRLFELLRGLVGHFTQQRQQVATEVTALHGSIDHLTRIIQAQQSHARSVGVLEVVSVDALLDAALDLQAASGSQLGIALERQLAELPRLRIDKHKVIEILVNLISNARQSLRDSGRADKRMRIRTEAARPAEIVAGVERVRIHIEDNGVGIDPAHRDKLFRLGFTTKREGSGIGLHSSAIAAQQLGGSLSFHSEGPGQGAVFTLELPVAPVMPEPPAGEVPAPGSPETEARS
jgi:two-component system sensor kinase FixL